MCENRGWLKVFDQHFRASAKCPRRQHPQTSLQVTLRTISASLRDLKSTQGGVHGRRGVVYTSHCSSLVEGKRPRTSAIALSAAWLAEMTLPLCLADEYSSSRPSTSEQHLKQLLGSAVDRPPRKAGLTMREDVRVSSPRIFASKLFRDLASTPNI